MFGCAGLEVEVLVVETGAKEFSSMTAIVM